MYKQIIHTNNGDFEVESNKPWDAKAIEETTRAYNLNADPKDKKKKAGFAPNVGFDISKERSDGIWDAVKAGVKDVKDVAKAAGKEGYKGVAGAGMTLAGKEKDTPVQNAVNNIFMRGATFGLSQYAEQSKQDTEEFIKNHKAVSGLTDFAGSVIPAVAGGGIAKALGKIASKGVGGAVVKGAANLPEWLKAAGGTGSYAAGRQAVDELGSDEEGKLGRILAAGGIGAATGVAANKIGKFTKNAVNRVNPIAAANNGGIYGAEVKSLNSAKNMIPTDIIDKTLGKGKRLTEGYPENATLNSLKDFIGKDVDARAIAVKTSKHPGRLPTNTREFYKDVGNVNFFQPQGMEGKTPGITVLGTIKRGLKKGANVVNKINKGTFTPQEYMEILKMDPKMGKQVLTSFTKSKGKKVPNEMARLMAIMQGQGNKDE
jgi:hypothetical protein